MEFDKSRVYTALNAEDLPIGSLCLFANTVESLRKKVQHEDVVDDSAKVFARRFNDGGDNQFVADGTTYNYAYLIKSPVAPQYKPFSTVENIFDAAQQHGMSVKEKINGSFKQVISIGLLSNGLPMIGVGFCSYAPEIFLRDFVFADDGSPCGEKVEGNNSNLNE